MKVTARLSCKKNDKMGYIQVIAYHDGNQKEISIGRKIDAEKWDKNRCMAKGKEYDLLNVQINNTRRALEEAIDSRIAQKLEVNLDNVFNEVFGSPVKKKSEKKSSDISLKNFINVFIEENPDKINHCSLNSYRSLIASLHKFEENDVMLKDVNVAYVNRYYNFLLNCGLKTATIQTRFKKLKKIISTAIIRGLMTEYPFGKGKLTVPGSRNGKRKFLEDYEVEKLIHYRPENDSELRVLRIIKFNLNAGLRIGDVLTLRKSDIIVQELSTSEKIFRLQKTTSKTDTDVNIKLTNQAKQQLLDSGFDNLSANDILFPWLINADFKDEVTLFKAIGSKTAYFNKVLAGICVKLEIKRISSHSLRHTFCTSLISKGVPITSIAKLVGHSDVSTTMIYAQIVQETVDDAIDKLES